jgi:hypothetical protein
MRDLMSIRTASLRLAASLNGWRRDPVALAGPDGAASLQVR